MEIIHVDKIDKIVIGWFVGDFAPTALYTDAAEVAVKRFKAGELKGNHLHKVTTAVTLVLEGTIEMYGRRLSNGDIFKRAPGEATDFTAITDSVTVAVKLPSVSGDKYAA